MQLEMRSPLAILAAALMLAACDGEPMEEPTPSEAPAIDEVPGLTNQNPITISGTGVPEAQIVIRGGADIAEATAGEDGTFSVEVDLTPDTENALVVSQTVDMLESQTVTVRVTHDGTPPETPSVNPVTSPTRRTMQTIRGTTEAGATVTITGGAEVATGEADENGRFEIPVDLNTTETGTEENALSIVARDAAGNDSAPAEVTITFDPSIAIEAPLLDEFPAFTNMGTVTLTGEAEAGVGIRAVGGEVDGDATVGDDGTFSVDVGLRPNERNMILVFAVSASETSIAAVAIITHDDIAPVAPSVDPEASPTGAEVVTLTGTAEPGVEIEVTGGAATATGNADDAGGFAIDVTLTEDADNELSVVARDAAGNESEPTTLAITHDGTLEDPIQVDAVVSPTREPTVTLRGTAAAEVEIEITGGAATVNTTSDSTGAWEAPVSLTPNARNELRVTQPGSGVDTIVVIVHDDIAPDAPTLNEIASPTSSTTVSVSGMTEPSASVSVAGGAASATGTAGPDGRFAISVTIAADADTTLSVIATDRAGNASAPSMVTVTHSSTVPDAPVVNVPNPAPTNAATHTVTGYITAPGSDIAVRVTGGAADATGTADPATGTFSVEVTLNANTVNTLTVVSITGSIESAPAIVTITHDDFPPPQPDGSLINVTRDSGGILGNCPAAFDTTGNVRGSAGSIEGLSIARVENLTRAAGTFVDSAPSTEMGSFNVTIASCSGDVMRIRAVDAAGNVSDYVEINNP